MKEKSGALNEEPIYEVIDDEGSVACKKVPSQMFDLEKCPAYTPQMKIGTRAANNNKILCETLS